MPPLRVTLVTSNAAIDWEKRDLCISTFQHLKGWTASGSISSGTHLPSLTQNENSKEIEKRGIYFVGQLNLLKEKGKQRQRVMLFKGSQYSWYEKSLIPVKSWKRGAWARLLGFVLAKFTLDGIQISFGAKSLNFKFKIWLKSWPIHNKDCLLAKKIAKKMRKLRQQICDKSV